MERLKLNIQKFATSGNCTSSTISAYGVNFSVTVYWNRVSTWNGTTCGSRINWWARVNTQGSGYTRSVTGGTVRINGTSYNVATGSFGDGASIASGNNFSIQHNNNGTKTFNITIDVEVGGSDWSYTSKDFTLDTIPRTSRIDSFTFDTDSQNRPNNIEEDFNVAFTRYDNNFTDNLTIQYSSNPQDSASWEDVKEITNYTSGSSISFTAGELDDLYASATTGNDIYLRAYLETYSGNTKIGESDKVTLTAKLYDADPIFSDFDVQDINSTTAMLTEGQSTGTVNQVINVNGYSNIQVTISSANKATPQKGATITKYRFVCGSKSVDIAYSDSASVSGTIIGAENGTYVVYAVDNRGNNTPITKLATSIKEYTPLKIDTTVGNNIKAERDNGGVGSNCTLTFSGEIWNNSFGSVSNSFKSAKYYLKKTDSSTWIDLGSSMTDITPTITNGTFSFSNTIRSDNADTTWDIGSSYDIKVVLEDKLSSVEVQTILASAIPTISLSKNGVGIMCDFDDSLGGYLQVNGQKVDPNASGIPNGSEFDFNGSTVPDGYEEVTAYSDLKAYTLYDNSSGSNGTITLNDTMSNYDYIEIFAKCRNNATDTAFVKVTGSSPNAALHFFDRESSNVIRFWYSILILNGNTISCNTHWYQYLILNTGNTKGESNSNYFYIYKVVGYKEV